MAIDLKKAVDIVDAAVVYAYNVGFDDFYTAMFPDANNDYVVEKYKQMQKSLGTFFGSLDSVHRRLFVAAALKRQADQRKRRR